MPRRNTCPANCAICLCVSLWLAALIYVYVASMPYSYPMGTVYAQSTQIVNKATVFIYSIRWENKTCAIVTLKKESALEIGKQLEISSIDENSQCIQHICIGSCRGHQAAYILGIAILCLFAAASTIMLINDIKKHRIQSSSHVYAPVSASENAGSSLQMQQLV